MAHADPWHPTYPSPDCYRKQVAELEITSTVQRTLLAVREAFFLQRGDGQAPTDMDIGQCYQAVW